MSCSRGRLETGGGRTCPFLRSSSPTIVRHGPLRDLTRGR
ncbi:lasso RiPP family leader peptide-containing protein [Streptomyces sp. NPDC046862]